MSNATRKELMAPDAILHCHRPLEHDDIEDVKYVRSDMVEEAMYVISRLLAYAQDVLSDPDQLKQFKKGVVERDVASALALISKAEGVLDDCD